MAPEHDILPKLIGISALGLVGYDVIANTRNQATRMTNLKQTKRLEDIYLRTSFTDSESQLQSTLQKWARSWHASDNWLFNMFDSCTSHVSCFLGNIIGSLSTIGLSAIALTTGKRFVAAPGKSLNILQKVYNKCNIINLPILNKVAAGLLAIKGAAFVLHTLFGVGGSDYTKHNIY